MTQNNYDSESNKEEETNGFRHKKAGEEAL